MTLDKDDRTALEKEADDMDRDLDKLKVDMLQAQLIDPDKEDAVLLDKLNRAVTIVHRSSFYNNTPMSDELDDVIAASLIVIVFAKMK